MGTPEFAAVSLERLAAWQRGEIIGVYTQPDRPAGRGHRLRMPPVKKLALVLGYPVFQPLSLKNPEEQERLAALRPDVIAVAAYGMILPQAVLDMPRLECVNVHASLLPAYRGAAPIQRAVMDSWRPGAVAGVTIMRVTLKLDSGPMFAADSLPVGEHTAGTLHDALAGRGADLLVRVLDDIVDGRARPVEQDVSLVTYAPKIAKEDGFVDWSRPAAQVHARIRGVTPRPGARVVLEPAGGAVFAPLSLCIAPGKIGAATGSAAPGTLRRDAAGLSIACADCWYELSTVRPQGKKDMTCRDLLNGALRGAPQGFCGVAHAPQSGE